MRLISTVIIGIALTACASKPPPLGPQPTSAALGPALTAPEIRNEIVGNTGIGTRTGTASTWRMYVAPDGTLASSSLQPPDRGTWHITDDGLFCMQWQRSWDGQPVCQSVHKAGIAVQFASARSVEEMTFVPGSKL
jgi:hypothetical protein